MDTPESVPTTPLAAKGNETSFPFKQVDRRLLVKTVAEKSRQPDFSKRYEQIIDQIDTTTGFFKICRELNLMDNIRKASFQNPAEDGLVFSSGSHEGGAYDYRTDLSLIDRSPPSRESILISLATTGDLPDSVVLGIHEESHDSQYPQNPLSRVVFDTLLNSALEDRITPGLEFLETVAYRLSSFEPHEASVASLIRHIATAKTDDGMPLYPDMDETQIRASARLVDQLVSLEVPVREICRLSHQGGPWDEQEQTYPQIRRKIIGICHDRGIPYPAGLNHKVEEYFHRKQQEQLTVRKVVLSGLGLVHEETAA